MTFGVSFLSGASTPSPGLAHSTEGNYPALRVPKGFVEGSRTHRRTPEGAGKCRVRSYGSSPSPCLTPLPWNMPLSSELSGRPGVYDLSDYYPRRV